MKPFLRLYFRTRATSSPFGFEGGFWYFRLRADFE